MNLLEPDLVACPGCGDLVEPGPRCPKCRSALLPGAVVCRVEGCYRELVIEPGGWLVCVLHGTRGNPRRPGIIGA